MNMDNKTHKVLSLISKTGANNLQVVTKDTPECGAKDVKIRVKFCGLNFAECMQRQVCGYRITDESISKHNTQKQVLPLQFKPNL